MRQNILWITAIIISLAIIIIVFFSIQNISQIIVTPTSPRITNTVSQLPTPTLDPNRDFSILLLGYGGGLHDGGTLTDSIVLANVIPHSQKINLISIPRDLWVSLPIGNTSPFYSKINSAYPVGNDDRRYPLKPIEFTGSAGGGQLAKKIVAEITSKPVDYFISLDFAGFTKIIDQLGGIDLRVSVPFEDKFYPLDIGTTDTCGKSIEEITALTATMSGDHLDQQFTCRYEDLKFAIGTTHIDGNTALKYARSRHSETSGGDFNRNQRQRQVMLAVKDRILSLNYFSKIIPVIKTLSAHMRTDIPISKIEEFISKANDFSQYKITSISLTDKNVLTQGFINRQSVLIPTGGVDNYHEIQQFILDQQISPTPTPTL